MALADSTNLRSDIEPALYALVRNALYYIAALAVAALGYAIVYVAAERSTLLALATIAAIPVVLLVIKTPRIGMLGFVFLICMLEEFPGGIAEDDVARSARTLFYSVSVGIPSLYLPDLILFGLIGLSMAKMVLQKSSPSLPLDRVGVAFVLMLAAIVISILISLGRAETFGPPELGSTFGFFDNVELPDNVARLIAVLQFKLFMTMFPAYVLGLIFFRERRDIDQCLHAVSLAIVATILLAVLRLLMNPAMVQALTTVIVDTTSIWLMACCIFYMVSMWAMNQYNSRQVLARVLVCAILAILILLSFRRTLWAAVVLAMMFWPFLLPKQARGRLIALFFFGFIMGAIFFLLTPIGQTILLSVIERASETTLAQGSTLYRFALLVWFIEYVEDLSLFGYGLTPLWNVTVQIRSFLVNMESVHSLFLWILLRMGIVGFLVYTVATYLIFSRMNKVYRLMTDVRSKVLIRVIFLSVVMFLFEGIANPVYGQVRHMILFGLAMALITRLPVIMRQDQLRST